MLPDRDFNTIESNFTFNEAEYNFVSDLQYSNASSRCVGTLKSIMKNKKEVEFFHRQNCQRKIYRR